MNNIVSQWFQVLIIHKTINLLQIQNIWRIILHIPHNAMRFAFWIDNFVGSSKWLTSAMACWLDLLYHSDGQYTPPTTLAASIQLAVFIYHGLEPKDKTKHMGIYAWNMNKRALHMRLRCCPTKKAHALHGVNFGFGNFVPERAWAGTSVLVCHWSPANSTPHGMWMHGSHCGLAFRQPLVRVPYILCTWHCWHWLLFCLFLDCAR